MLNYDRSWSKPISAFRCHILVEILKDNNKNTLVPLAPQAQNLISVCDHSSSFCAAVIIQLGWHQHNFISAVEG